MKVEDAVRAFLHSLVKFLNNKNYLTSNVEVEFFEVEFFEINSLENIIQSVRGTISDQKISDILKVIFDILGEQEEEVLNKDIEEYCKIKTIYIVDNSTEKFKGKVRNFSFADTKGRGAVISKSFFVNMNLLKNVLNENDFQELKGNIFELIVYLGSHDQEIEKFLNFLFEDTAKNSLVLIKKDETLAEEELYTFLYLNYLAKGYKTKLDDKVIYNYQLNPNMESKIKSLNDLKLSQFFEIFDVFDEYQHTTDVLSRFLKLYQIIEYLLIRVMLVKIQQRTGQHKQFLRVLMGIKKRDDFDKRLFRELFDNERNDLINWLRNLVTDNDESIKNEIERFLNKPVDITQNSDEYWLNLLVGLLYQLRNSIVHNKESEYHITIHSTTPSIADLLREILSKFENIILEKLVENNEKISYTSRELWLY